MKRTIILSVLVVAVLAVPRVRRQMFGDLNPRTIPQLMSNTAAVGTYVKCMLATPEEATKICDKIGRIARDLAPKLLEKGDCPGPCTEDEKRAFAYAVRTFQTKYPNHYTNILKKYNVPPEKQTQLEEWAAAMPPL